MEFINDNITFIIVTFKSNKVIFDCLDSLPEQVPKIIVENSSDIELKKKIEQNYDNTKVVLSSNIGMGPGNNLGIKKCNTKYAYILNPDTKFHHDTFAQLNNSIKELNDFGILSPVSDNEDFPNYKRKNNSNITDNIFDVEEVDGYSMIINKEKFNNKFFDENFFMYLENNDLCLRCKKMGEKIFIVNNSKISHLGAKAVDSKYSHEVELSRNWHWMWSKFYFNKKYKGFFFALIFSFPNLFFTLLKFIFYFIFFKSKKNIYKMRLFGLLNSIVGKKAWYRPNIN